MARTGDATALAMLAAVIMAGLGAVTVAFDDLSTPPALAGDLEAIVGSLFEILPLALLLIVGYLVVIKLDLV
jgi:hypothetical protein